MATILDLTRISDACDSLLEAMVSLQSLDDLKQPGSNAEVWKIIRAIERQRNDLIKVRDKL